MYYPQFDHLAAELAEWFDSVFESIQKSLFGIVPEGPHRDAVVVDWMIRNARILHRKDLAEPAQLYTPRLLSRGGLPASARTFDSWPLASGIRKCMRVAQGSWT